MADEPDIGGVLLTRLREPLVAAVLAAATGVLAAGVVTVAVHTTDPTSAPTVLRSVRAAVVETADGVKRPAVVGMTVPRGAYVRTGGGGAAQLVTQGRSTYLGALATLKVVDGVHEELESGEVMVDAQHGPRLALSTVTGDVAVPADALVRVRDASPLRVGVFSGGARFVPAGRSTVTTIAPYYQVLVSDSSTAPTPTPLQLVPRDRWEAELAPQLVAADADLEGTAAQLQGADGSRVLTAAPAAFRAVPTGTALGDHALSLLLAEAGHAGGSTADRLSTVQDGRVEHGSWGVLAAIVDAQVKDVSGLLDQGLPTVTVAAAPSAPAVGPATAPAPGATRAPGSAPSVPTSTRSSRPSPRPTRTRTRTPGPAPTPSPSSGPVTTLLTTVLGLINPSPTPAPNSTGLVNGITGGIGLGGSSGP